MSRRLRILMNNFCNYNCIFCHNDGQSLKPILAMRHTPQVLRGIMDSIENKDIFIEKVIFSGGEPTLIKTLPKYVGVFKDKNPTIITNGYALDYDFQKSLVDNGLREIYFSLSTLEPSDYAYLTRTSLNSLSCIIKNIKDGSRLPVRRYINVVLLRNVNDNVSTIRRLLWFAEKYKIDGVQIIELVIPPCRASVSRLFSPVSNLEYKLIGENMIFDPVLKTDRKTLYKLVNNGISVTFTRCSFYEEGLSDVDIVIDSFGNINFSGLNLSRNCNES